MEPDEDAPTSLEGRAKMPDSHDLHEQIPGLERRVTGSEFRAQERTLLGEGKGGEGS